MFALTLGEDVGLMPRTVAIAEAYQALLEVDHDRLADWFPGFVEALTSEGTRSDLEQSGQAWLEGSQLPLAIAVRVEDAWRLVGAVRARARITSTAVPSTTCDDSHVIVQVVRARALTLLIDGPAQSGEVGYWLDAGFEGHGMATQALTAVFDQAFGPFDLHRIELRTIPTNSRSRSVARRLGFTQEGVLCEAAVFPGERRDEVVYGLLASEWIKEAN
jgi:hypothetical protein